MIKPIGDKVVVLPAKKEEKTSGGIYIPETAQERPNHATVVCVGPGSQAWPQMSCKKGDNILYNKFQGTEITVEDELYIILEERDIFAIL